MFYHFYIVYIITKCTNIIKWNVNKVGNLLNCIKFACLFVEKSVCILSTIMKICAAAFIGDSFCVIVRGDVCDNFAGFFRKRFVYIKWNSGRMVLFYIVKVECITGLFCSFGRSIVISGGVIRVVRVSVKCCCCRICAAVSGRQDKSGTAEWGTWETGWGAGYCFQIVRFAWETGYKDGKCVLQLRWSG